ncbi:flagella synthesis protein FlgN [Pseudomonas sp.]|uniref:flagella synthesis protein FlgN n=1 Tax=Pseudomonas sp. TaxID=306 RepID=UPI003D14C815
MSRREQLLQVAEQDVQQDCADYLSLRGLMQELYQQLLNRNSQQIDLLNDQISHLVDQVRGRAERRSKILTAFGLGAGAPAVQQLFGLYPEGRGDHLRQTWQQLNQLVLQCKRLNERNGKLLAMHNDILNQMLGEQLDNQLYTPHFF